MTGPYDEIPFRYDAKSPTTAIELEKGDLLISGWAMRFDEIDWEGERWNGLSDRLWHSLKRFVDRKGPLAYQHQGDTVGIGRVIDCERVPGVGVRVKAVLGYQEPGTKWRHIYEAARKSYLPRFSLGGLFMRSNGPDGPILQDAEFNELSICGSSIGKGTTWDLIAQKALTCHSGKAITSAGEVVDGTNQLREIKAQLGQLKHALGATGMDYFAGTTKARPIDTRTNEQRRLQDAADHERHRKAAAAQQAEKHDDGLASIEEIPLHSFWGVEPVKKDPDGKQEITLSPEQTAAAFGVQATPQKMDRMPGEAPLDLSTSALAVFGGLGRKPSVLDGIGDRFDKAIKRKQAAS